MVPNVFTALFHSADRSSCSGSLHCIEISTPPAKKIVHVFSFITKPFESATMNQTKMWKLGCKIESSKIIIGTRLMKSVKWGLSDAALTACSGRHVLRFCKALFTTEMEIFLCTYILAKMFLTIPCWSPDQITHSLYFPSLGLWFKFGRLELDKFLAL